MKRWVAAVVVLAGVLGWHSQASASCTYHYIHNGSRTVVCTVCCYGSICHTSCT